MANTIILELPKSKSKPETSNPPTMSGFKIIRLLNGKEIEIELTTTELEVAYRIREHEYYISDVEMTLEELEGLGDMRGHTAAAIIENEEVFGDMVEKYAINRDKYDMEWHAAAVNAVKDALSAAEKSGLLTMVVLVSDETEVS